MADILIVDDEPAVREALHALLERLGHRVTEAGSGQQGIERFGQGTFDLVVSDVIMPEMNGFDFLQALQPLIHEQVPFVILSSHEDREGVKAAIYAGAFDYVFKPFEEEQVCAVVDRALDQRRRWVDGVGGGSAAPSPAFVPPGPAPCSPPPSEPGGSGRGVGAEVIARGAKVVTVTTPGAGAGEGGRRPRRKGLFRRLIGRR